MVAAEDEEEIFETQGPDERLRRAGHTGTGEIPRAQKSTFKTIDSYLQDAVGDRAVLVSGRLVNRDGNIGDIRTIRADVEILNVVADYLHGREILDRGLDDNRNTNLFKNRHKYWRGFMQAAAQPGFASDETLLRIYETAWESAQARTEYWRTQTQTAYKKVGHVLVNDVQETVIPVRVAEEPATPTKTPIEVEATASHPWENFKPPTPIGGNYQIEGIAEIPIVQKEGDDEAAPLSSVPQPESQLPKQLFSTTKIEKEAKRKTKKSQRPKVTRNNLGAGGKMIADDDKELEFDRRAAEGRL
jgi:hypothetical protein